MKLLFTIFSISSSFFLFSQNLVPNPSFEEKNTTKTTGVWLIKNWSGASSSVGDYYYRNNTDKSSNVPTNEFGNQEPHIGNAYTGICIKNDIVEYIEAELIKPLVKGQEYKISIFISKADKRHSYVKEFGILFLPKKKSHFLHTGINEKPDVVFVNENGYKNNNDWVELSETYVARGEEAVLVFGHFLHNEPDGFHGKAHYYIDDVSITPVDEEEKKDTTQVVSTISDINKTIPFSIDTFRLQDLNFKFGTATLEGNYDILLSDPLSFLIRYPEKMITVEGYTDNIGNEEKNKKLSEERAKAVGNYLVQKGIDKSRISCKGYGSSRPIAGNNTEDGRYKNRRVEIIVR
jgi:outer membrane protein OmpA-like peptidoglycan-associated protein